MSITLYQEWRSIGSSYPEKFNETFLTIQNFVNTLEQRITGISSGVGSVTSGLQEIFDRRGLIGIGSYDFDEGVKATEELVVALGGYWNGLAYYSRSTTTTISLAGLTTGTYYVNIDASGNPSVSASPGLSTTRQFTWTATTSTVSAKALYTGVSILFDGDDYQASRAAYDSLAERLDAMALGSDPFGGYYSQGTHSGLNFYYLAGKVRDDSAIYDTVAGHVTLADNTTNYVEVDPTTGTVSDNATSFTAGSIPLYIVVTASGAITTITDQRTAAMAQGTGVGGGHTQGTDTGTTATNFLLDSDASGSPTGRAGIEVENGSDPNASIKYNRDTGKWEISVDGGTTWNEVLTPELINQDGQQWSKHIQLADPPEAYLVAGRDSSVAWEELDLSSYITEAPDGCIAVLLRVWFLDSGGGNIQFRPGGGVAVGDAHTVWTATNEPQIIMLAPSPDFKLDFWVTASGSGTANVKVLLLGYAANITGVGTLDRTFTSTGLAVAAATGQTFNLTGFLNRGIVHYFKISETGGLGVDSYDVEVFKKDTFLAADLLYKAEGILSTADFEDWLDWFAKDSDSTRELHLKITNNDASVAGTFSITLEAEQFA